jgi:hypothetical protein
MGESYSSEELRQKRGTVSTVSWTNQLIKSISYLFIGTQPWRGRVRNCGRSAAQTAQPP